MLGNQLRRRTSCAASLPLGLGGLTLLGAYSLTSTVSQAEQYDLDYSTFLGGAAFDQATGSIRVDNQGSLITAGQTHSGGLPTASAARPAHASAPDADAVIAKFSADGSSLVYSTFIGGSAPDIAWAGATMDTAGNAYLASLTQSTDFPTTAGVVKPVCNTIDIEHAVAESKKQKLTFCSSLHEVQNSLSSPQIIDQVEASRGAKK